MSTIKIRGEYNMTDGQFTIQLEVTGDAESSADPAILGEIARNTIVELCKENYNVQPVYTGQKGGQELFEIWKLIEQGAMVGWQHHKGIAELVTTVSTVVVAIKNAQAKIVLKQNIPTLIKITINNKKSGISKIVEGNDPEAVAKTVKELVIEDPGVTASGQVKVTAHVQQQSKRRRR
jgi:hypothetical protein